tara:strand:- start:8504 stop:9820 length:1317 start_codon:yes stop_codon:yes gene_type:complete
MNKLSTISIALVLSGLAGISYAADAPLDKSSPIDLNIGGEVALTGLVIDGKCKDEASTADVFANELDDTDANSITADLVTLGFASGSTLGDPGVVGMAQNPCVDDGVNEKSPSFVYSKELNIEASGTLVNGLELTYADTIDLTDIDSKEDSFELSLGGAFGRILFKDSTSAVDSMLIGTTGSGAKTAFDGVTLTNHRTLVSDGHVTTTSGGDGGINVIYFTPSLGGMDIALGYNHNTDNEGLDNSEFKDTYSVGVAYETYVGDVTIALGGGIEKASSSSDTAANCLTTDLAAAEAASDSGDLFDGLYGSDVCGDETLKAIGADIGIGDYTLSSAFSQLDSTDGGDTSVWSFGFGRTIDDVDYTFGYTQEQLDYARDKVNGDDVQDRSDIMMMEAVKSLGEGVDLGLNISNVEIDRASEELGNGAQDAWRAGVSITVGF